MAKKKCFVIMPFSKTKSTSAKNWNNIFEKIIKRAVEGANLEFECKRSKATRGNIIKEIVNEINDSDLVIADMTDLNPNVCYELGMRHGLKPGTILLAQNRKFLSIFDLNNYASHVYNWKTPQGKAETISKIRELLIDFLNDPSKPDNPAQDFLQHKPSFIGASTSEIKDIIEYDSQGAPQIVLSKKHLSGKLSVGLILLGNSKSGLAMGQLVEQVSKNWKKVIPSDISSILSQLQNDGLVFKEGSRGKYVYRLSKKGRQEFLNLINVIKKN